MERQAVRILVNGKAYRRTIEPRLTLADFLRDRLRLTGTHLGCEHGVCGACTVIVNGDAIRSCLMLAVQADGCKVLTVEGLSDGKILHPLQAAFHESHGLQCGFCTPGLLMAAHAFLLETPQPSEEEIRIALSGNICRCTGYESIIRAVRQASASRS